MRDRRVRLVRIDAPKAVCVDRVATRLRGRNLSNDTAMTERFHEFWYEQVAPTYAFAAAVDGTDAESALEVIQRLLQSR